MIEKMNALLLGVEPSGIRKLLHWPRKRKAAFR